MALMGAEVLLYPTAIGSDPPVPDEDSRDAWQTVQRGHATANMVPLVAANRIGIESAPGAGAGTAIRFYGSSFVASETGALLAQASRDREEVVTATVDLDAVRYRREDWTFFRDRRPELYGPLLTLDGARPGQAPAQPAEGGSF
jgi:N-carbamoylputrescine amidase